MEKTIKILEYLSTLECTARVHETYTNGYSFHSYDYEQSMPSLMEMILNSDCKEPITARRENGYYDYEITVSYNARKTVYNIKINGSLYSNS